MTHRNRLFGEPAPADARGEAIDFVNRVNFLFDRWEPEALLDAFTDDVVVDHPLGRSVGREQLQRFLTDYEPITRGVRRHNCNHVVEALEDGDLQVTYYILLVRIAPSSAAEDLKNEPMTIMHYERDLPKLISYAMVTDTLARRPDGRLGVRHKRVENVAEDVAFHF
ncbi:hypothetical protein E2F50_03575 [Rhizobium deserti]|uniref:SnoaL-like domain-containing protein n=1 Tax=Rhizobium deserti TaxID=2547961 RepID=A0A4R5UMU9_9HYPH|nr:nuclear transport factor 2 family protein [Rhizobium deserti]TDK39215.1 hypothetical protein E2F50_03575 [Rhizobium deserti]